MKGVLITPYFGYTMITVQGTSSMTSMGSYPPPPYTYVLAGPNAVIVPQTSVAITPVATESLLIASGVFPSRVGARPSFDRPYKMDVLPLVV